MKMTKIAATVAAAALLVIGAAFTSMAADLGWQMEDGQWVYLDADGERYAECFKKSADGNQYWLNEEGYMATDFLIEGTDTYYVDASGKRVANAWVKVYNEEDEADYWFYFGSNGKAIKATEKDYEVKSAPVSTGATEKAKFVFDENGHLITGYMTEDYVPCDDGQDADDCWYYAGGEDDGILRINKWEELEYVNSSDDTKTGWFFFQKGDDQGRKAVNKTIRWNKVNYTLDGDGVMITGSWSTTADLSTLTPASLSEVRRYDETGAIVKSKWFKTTAPNYVEDTDDFVENWYYAGKDGALYAAKIAKIGAKYYGFDTDATMLTGLQELTFSGETIEAADAPAKWTDVEEDEITLGATSDFYYFGSPDDADIDGAMKMGTGIEVTIDDETKTMGFEASGENKGAALNGFVSKSKVYYNNGVKIAADDESKFILLKITDETTAEIVTAKELLASGAKVTKNGSTVGKGIVGVSTSEKVGTLTGNGTLYAPTDAGVTAVLANNEVVLCIGQTGTAAGKGVKTNGDDYKIYVSDNTDKTVTGVYYLY